MTKKDLLYIIVIIVILVSFYLYKEQNDYIKNDNEDLKQLIQKNNERNMFLLNENVQLSKQIDSLNIDLGLIRDQKNIVKIKYQKEYEKINYLPIDSVASKFSIIFTKDHIN
jgi:hypothetical protein